MMRWLRWTVVAALAMAAQSAFGAEKTLDALQLRDALSGTTVKFEKGSHQGFPLTLTFDADGTLHRRVEAPVRVIHDQGTWNVKRVGLVCIFLSRLGGGRDKGCFGLVLRGETRMTRIRGDDHTEMPNDMIVTKPGPGFAYVVAAVLHPAPPVATAMRSPTPVATTMRSPTPAEPPAAPANGAFDLAFWESIKDSRNPEDYRAYLRQFPNGRFAELAKVRGRTHRSQATRLPPPRVQQAALTPAARSLPSAYKDIHFGKYYAVVIGNNDYRYLNHLKTAVNDARAVARELESDYGFDVSLLENATRGDILGELAKLRAKLMFDDNLLIYYAGHGVLDEVGQQGYWLPVDAESGVPTNWISTSDITVMLRAIRAKHIMVVADSCYSGTLVRSAIAAPKTAKDKIAWITRMLEKRTRVAIVSGGLEPVTDSGGNGDHSVFASAFLEALHDNRGVMEGQALFNRIKRPIVLNADQTPQYSDIRKAGHDGGEFMFVRQTN